VICGSDGREVSTVILGASGADSGSKTAFKILASDAERDGGRCGLVILTIQDSNKNTDSLQILKKKRQKEELEIREDTLWASVKGKQAE
jgi:hypothetical protein